MIKSNEVKTYINRLYCDNCGEEMVMCDYVLLSSPAQYIYRCPECGDEIRSHIQYPQTEYQKVGKK